MRPSRLTALAIADVAGREWIMPKSTVMVYTEGATAPGAGGAARRDSGTAPAGVLRPAAVTIAGFLGVI